jgi:hypothetical protein
MEGLRAEFSGNGWHWESPWKNQAITFSHATPGVYLDIAMPEEIANKLAEGNASVKMEIAFDIYHLDHAQMVDTRPDEFEVPGVGRCRWSEASALEFLRSAWCDAPLVFPAVRVFQVDAADETCPLQDSEGPVPPGHFSYAVEFRSSFGPDPNPVHSFVLASSPWIPAIPDGRSPGQSRDAMFCRGTRFTVRTGRAVQQLRAKFDLGDVGSEEPLPKRGGEDDE